jgi:parvulin-like peptidyl-prolyl isomerase
MEGRKHTDTLRCPFYALRIAFLVSFCLSFIAIPSSGLTKERIIDLVIAVVNDQPITRRELENEPILFVIVNFVRDQPITIRELERELTSQEIRHPPQTVRRAALEGLIERELMLQKADDIGILLGSWGKKVNAEIQALKSGYANAALFFEDLKRIGLEYQEVEERLRNALIMNELTVRQFGNSIDEEQINQKAPQYFEENRSEFIEPAQIQFQYILVPSQPDDAADLQTQAKTLAETITSQLKEGATFQEVQEAYPDNPLLQVVEEPQTLPADTEGRSAIADLEINGVSQPIPIPEGYLIAKLLKKEMHPRQKTYPEVSQEIQNKLIGEELQKQRKEWLAEQKATADIRILDAELAKIPLPLTTTED